MRHDTDSTQRGLYVVHIDYRGPVEEKGRHSCSLRESISTLAQTGFYYFLIAYIKGFHSLCSGLLQVIALQITKDVTDYFHRLTRKKCCKCKGMIRVIDLVTLHPWENQHRVQEVSLKMCSKHLQLQFRVREFQQKLKLYQASKQPRYNGGLVSQLIRGFGSCVLTRTCWFSDRAGLHLPLLGRPAPYKDSLKLNVPQSMTYEGALSQ